MKPSIRNRVFWSMIALGTVPLGIALVLLVNQMRARVSPAGPRAALEEITESSRGLLQHADSLDLPDSLAAALDTHADVVGRGTRLARQADTITRTAANAMAVAILGVGLLVLLTSVILARKWSAAITQPIEEMIDWVERIDRREPLPEPGAPGVAEYEPLKGSLRTMSENLAAARAQVVEQERLHAFRETARRVAHEIRGPLTAIRLALGQLQDTTGEPYSVLNAEAERLDRLAREFADFGRLASGPSAEVDVGELLREITAHTPDLRVNWHIDGTTMVHGRYESLRRAFQNLIANAARVTDERGIDVKVTTDAHRTSVAISDYGPGVPVAERDHIFDPYVTGRAGGTGLGLAITRQAITDHHGTIEVGDAPSGGAVFTVHLPNRA